MASPYVAGVAALMLAVWPELTSAQILGIMRTTSTPLPGHDFAWRNDTGFGMIDAAACVAEVARRLGHAGRVTMRLRVFHSDDGDCLLLSPRATATTR